MDTIRTAEHRASWKPVAAVVGLVGLLGIAGHFDTLPDDKEVKNCIARYIKENSQGNTPDGLYTMEVFNECAQEGTRLDFVEKEVDRAQRELLEQNQ